MGKLKDMHTPVFWAEGHPGPLAAEGWQVQLGGLVEQPITLTWEKILALPKSIADALCWLKRTSVRAPTKVEVESLVSDDIESGEREGSAT